MANKSKLYTALMKSWYKALTCFKVIYSPPHPGLSELREAQSLGSLYQNLWRLEYKTVDPCFHLFQLGLNSPNTSLPHNFCVDRKNFTLFFIHHGSNQTFVCIHFWCCCHRTCCWSTCSSPPNTTKTVSICFFPVSF